MKHNTPTLSKFKKLGRRLETDVKTTVGIVELLWIACQINTPRGDIGAKLDNEEIAIACDWGGEPDELITALVDTGWLDEHPEHRLVVHDWADHAPYYIRGIAARQGGFAVAGSLKPKSATTDANDSTPTTSATNVADVREQQPNLTQPNKTKPHPTPPAPSAVADVDDWGQVVDELIKCKVSTAKAAAQAARDRGRTVADVEQLIEEYRQANGAYGPGALHGMLTGTLAKWPPPSKKHSIAKSRAESTDRAERQRQEGAVDRARAEGEGRERQRREERCGPRYDAMSAEEKLATEAAAIPDEAVRRMTRPNMRRAACLELLASQELITSSNGQAAATA
jgi:hypothetical protein